VDAHVDLIAPTSALLASYEDALARDWSSAWARTDHDQAQRELEEIREDPEAFIDLLNHPTRGDSAVTLPNGQVVPRIPGIRRWLSDGDYCGAISLRWQPGTSELPDYCLGHIGYAVVPWKRRRGYGTEALRQMIDLARKEGLEHVDLVTAVDNVASQAVILANGGVLIEEFITPEEHESFEALRFRVVLAS
jgi:predicted acetyltransferase